MNTHIHSLDTHKQYTRSFCGYTCDEYTIYSDSLESHVINTHIHSLEPHVMRTHLFSGYTWDAYTRYFDPRGTFAPLTGLHRLISCPMTISSHNHYYRSQVLSAWQLGFAIFLRSLVLLSLAPVLCSATCYGSLSYSLKKIRYQQCSTLSVFYLDLLALCLAPCSLYVCFLVSIVLWFSPVLCLTESRTSAWIGNRSFVSLRLTPALRSATSSNDSLSNLLKGIQVQSQQNTQQPTTIRSDALPASPRELPACHTSACNNWYTYYTSHNWCSPRSTLHQQCFPSTSTIRICTYRRNNWPPSIAQHFHTRLFRHPAHVCLVQKCHPALS